ncbi:protein FAM133-like [Salvia splendens]|uniref:protein FAM133-like n=1 Tax=Salvia splendens TaxID=180675 RepID=UPI001C26EC90|nr:protein FAM133-like [Salvia splendens]
MGKNQAYKAMQRGRLGSTSAGPEEAEDGLVDSSFHSPEWHAARLASLKTSHTVTWEEYKKKQKEEALKKGELEADKDRMMIEYRAQLDAERARKLARGSNYSSSKGSHKKDKKDRDSRKHSSRKRKHSRRSSDSSSSSSETSSTDDDEREAKRSRRRKKEKRKSSRSRSKHSSKGDKEADGPLPLSRFFGSLKG